MILFSSNPVKLVRKLKEGIEFVNLKTGQKLVRPATYFDDNEDGKHLNYELMRLDIEESEYKVWMKENS